MYNVIDKEKVTEQHILRKYCNCNRVRVKSHSLKVGKIAITHLSLSCPPNPPKFQGHENLLGKLIEKNSVAAVVMEKSA